MNRWILCALIACGVVSATATGATNVIVQHNANLEEGTHYRINQLDMRVEVLLGVEGQTFEFEAMVLGDPNDPNTYVDPGDISTIVADPNAGPVALTIIGHNGHAYGAQNVGQVNLLPVGGGVTGMIAALNIAGNLNAIGATHAHGAGDLSIGGTMLDLTEIKPGAAGAVHIGTLAAVFKSHGSTDLTVDDTTPQAAIEIWGAFGPTAGEMRVYGALDHLWILNGVLAPVTAEGDIGELELGTIDPPTGTRVSVGHVGSGSVAETVGDLKIAGLENLETGSITGTLGVSSAVGSLLWVHGAVTGTLNLDVVSGEIRLDEASSGTIEIARMERGTFRSIDGDFGGRLIIDETALAATIRVGFRVNELPTYANLTGSVQVVYTEDGAISLYVSGALADPYDPNIPGSLPLSGGYITLPSYCGEMDVQGGMAGTREFIAVNYDGGVPYYDSWCLDAGIQVAGTMYGGNTPAARIWQSSPCKADLNGDGSVTFTDINPFVAALSDRVAYSVRYFPGLGGTAADGYAGGSRVWHGDLNCDGSLSFKDINPFVTRITEGCCSPYCGPCGGEQLRGEGLEGENVPDLSPSELAAELALNIEPELYDSMIALIEEAIAEETDDQVAAYWADVYGALTN